MAEKKEKEYTVNLKSVGTQLSYNGKIYKLNNGIPQTTLKAMYADGMKCITKKAK